MKRNFITLLRIFHRRNASANDVLYAQAVHEPKLKAMSDDRLADELDRLSLEYDPYSRKDLLLYEAAMRLRK